MTGGEIAFELPMPPSTNNLFVTDKRTHKRFPSPAYKAWRKNAADVLGAQYARFGAPSLHKPVELRIRLNLDHKGDIANREKAITDLLVQHLDMPDDRWIDRIIIERDRTVEAVVVEIAAEFDGLTVAAMRSALPALKTNADRKSAIMHMREVGKINDATCSALIAEFGLERA